MQYINNTPLCVYMYVSIKTCKHLHTYIPDTQRETQRDGKYTRTHAHMYGCCPCTHIPSPADFAGLCYSAALLTLGGREGGREGERSTREREREKDWRRVSFSLPVSPVFISFVPLPPSLSLFVTKSHRAIDLEKLFRHTSLVASYGDVEFLPCLINLCVHA